MSASCFMSPGGELAATVLWDIPWSRRYSADKQLEPRRHRRVSLSAMSREVWEQLRSWSWEPGTAAVLADIDGVLAPIVPTPDISEVSGELRDLLRRLSERYRLV